MKALAMAITVNTLVLVLAVTQSLAQGYVDDFFDEEPFMLDENAKEPIEKPVNGLYTDLSDEEPFLFDENATEPIEPTANVPTPAVCGSLPPTQCERTYEKVGGFVEEKNRVMPELLLTDRDCSSNKSDGHKLEWSKFEASFHSLACRCAKIARDKGYKVFGLQNYGECWSGPSAESNFTKYGKADPSKSFQYFGNPPPPCDKTIDQECVGGAWINYVYRLKDNQHSSDVDGGYSKWSNWTACSKTCGGGVKGRERTCTNPKPSGKGKTCSGLGPAEESLECAKEKCVPDVDGGYSKWSGWTTCSKTCGGGVKGRERTCTNPKPSGNGKDCSGLGAPAKSAACNKHACFKSKCKEALVLGMENRRISPGSLSASSIWDYRYVTDQGRLNMKPCDGKKGSWAARYNDKEQYFQVDFNKTIQISKILTQGREDSRQWVTSYWVSYSEDNGVYIPLVYGKNEGKKGNLIFVGNNDRNTIKTNEFSVPIFARYLRVHPWSWHGHISMRFEFYGCTEVVRPPPVPKCLTPLGLQSGAVPDSKMSSSSEWDHNLRAANGRLYFDKNGTRRGGWSAVSNQGDQWLQVDFEKTLKVRMVGTQGLADASQWVVNYWVSYSRDGVFWDKTDILQGNSDHHAVVRNLIKPFVYGRYFRIHPQQYHGHMSMRAEFYGCTSGFKVPTIQCIGILGMEDGSIPDEHITASSMIDANYSPARARLGISRDGLKGGAWSAKTNDEHQWLEVDLGKLTKVTRVATQGCQDKDQWVKSYSLQSCQDGKHFVDYEQGKILRGNCDRNTVEGTVLEPPVIARFMRFVPKTWFVHISMRVEVYGCLSDLDGGYSNWDKWTQCSKTCGGGVTHRSRECNNPEPQGHGKNCSGLGSAEQSKECANEKCIPDVDGGYSNWTEWTTCSKTCGGGVTNRSRECNNPKPQGHGKDCSKLGAAEESKECAKEKCIPNVDGGYSNWTEWTTCSKTCGGGVTNRSRECNNPKPHGYGKDCSKLGAAEESKECAKEKCIPDVDGGYSNWTEWTTCSKTCGGGVTNRSRECNNPKPHGHGKDCSKLGAAEESKECAKEKCIPDVDGGYSNWTEWTTCSKTCGGGVTNRSRECNNPKPHGYGKDCSKLGAAEESKECAKEKCIPDVDGGYSNWTEWTTCSKTCGGGVTNRSRECNNPKPHGHGKDCSKLGAAEESKECAKEKCIPDVDGGYSNWTEWTTCSKTCGGGVTNRSRECNNPKPHGYGKDCSKLGAAEESKECAKEKCIPDVDGGYSNWTEWTTCSKTCGGGVTNRSRECNNPKPHGYGKDCSKLGAAEESKECAKEKCIPDVDGGYSNWTEWTTCSKTCGGGVTNRSRECNNPKPHGYGKDCSKLGAAEESKECAKEKCIPDVDGGYSNWTEWTTCSKTCGGGVTNRSRECNNPKPHGYGKDCSKLGAAEESKECAKEKCIPDVDGGYSNWTEWTTCSKTCGGGVTNRSRECNNPKPHGYGKDCSKLGAAEESKECAKEKCIPDVDGGYSNWTEWTTCSKTCGGGVTNRSRECNNPKPHGYGKDCSKLGAAEESKECAKEKCIPDVDGGYSNWTEWTTCSKTCGGGVTNRSRECNNPKPHGYGKDCSKLGAAEESKECAKEKCIPDVDGGYSNWTEWTTCSKTCGGGVTNRSRECNNPKPHGYGKDCSKLGAAEESKECAKEKCIPDVDGGYSNWTEWTTCSKTCGGGVTNRSRECNNPKPHGHGKDCSKLGAAEESKECAKEKCIPDVDGGYSNWTEWTTCSKTCGGGVTNRSRECNNPKPHGYGKDCSKLGAAEESKECAKEKCIPDVDGGYSNWTEWTTCSKTCGGGVTNRSRECNNPKPHGHGKDCSKLGAAEESKECAKEKCIPDVDGGYSNWTEWTTCSKTCGGGVTNRSRECNNPKPHGYGKDCSKLGAAEESKECAKEKCIPDVDGGYSNWTEWTTCSKTCGGGVTNRSRECNNPKPHGHGKDCSKLGAAEESKECAKEKCIPDVDGGYSNWTEWTTCSKTCGGGVTNRSRECNNPKPHGYGKDCSKLGAAEESKECAKEKCIPDVDGGYSNWTEWTTCSKTCGGGVTNRSRECNNPKPHGYGKDCSKLGAAEESKECAKEQCILDVDGGYSNWTEWTTCSKTCGGGASHRSRKCNNPKPQGYGKDCSKLGPALESKECAKEQCIPDVDGGYSNWTEWTTCTKTCGGGATHRSRKCNNPKPQGHGKDCSKLGAAEESKECGTENCIPDVDGGYSNWTEWAICSKTCGGGVSSRSRKCNNPKPQGHGKDCSKLGPTEESKECGTENCIPDVDGGYSNWTEWTICTKTCGGGITRRSRKCNNPKPQGHGKDCSKLGHAVQAKKCAKERCIPKCQLPLGLESGKIVDNQITASSIWNSRYRAANARLHFKAGSGRTGAWSARRNNFHQWLQVDFGKIAKIKGMATQGRQGVNQWVTKYSLSYSREGILWNDCLKVYNGNNDQSSVVRHQIRPVIYARYVRVLPKAWHSHISMRVEFYGCTSGFSIPPLKCAAALGMQSKAIPDSNISASSVWDGNHGVARARLNTVRQGRKTGAWSARRNNLGQWIQVDLGKIVKITRIVTQGRQDYKQWVKSYKLQFSLDGGHFEEYEGGRKFLGNNDRNSMVGHILDKPIITRFLRLRPLSWHRHISMRLELYGCTSGFRIPKIPKCGKDIHIYNHMMTSSSQWNAHFSPSNAKLYFLGSKHRAGAWASRRNNIRQWLQVKFDRVMKITRTATQGSHSYSEWVKSYSLEYSKDGVTFIPYKENGVIKVFQGNRDRRTVVSHKLRHPIKALAIAFRPRTWHRQISMRVGVYGCPTGEKPLLCHQPMDVGIILDRSGSVGWNHFKMAKQFVARMIKQFQESNHKSRFGIIAYNYRAKTIVKFSQRRNQNPYRMQRIVNGIRYTKGGTRTDRALRKAYRDLFRRGSRATKVLFVLTDGKTNHGSAPYYRVLRPLLRKGVKVIAVGIGYGVNKVELRQIANGNNRNVISIRNYETLSKHLNDIDNKAC